MLNEFELKLTKLKLELEALKMELENTRIETVDSIEDKAVDSLNDWR